MRMKQLDTLRAFAVGLVMVAHFAGQTVNDQIPIGAGSIGVGCFFTLSGFLITGILLQSFADNPEHKWRAWRDFYARRLLRLVPPFYAVLFGLVLLGIEPIASSWPWHAAYLTNVWIALGHPDNVFWSLSVEEQFYLLWPFVIALVPRRWLVHAVVAMIASGLVFKTAILLAGLDTRAVTRLLLGNLTLLSAGCLLAIASYQGGRANRFDWYEGRTAQLFTLGAAMALTLAVLSWAVFPVQGGLVRYFTNNILCGTVYAWLILQAAIGIEGFWAPLFDSPALQYIGRISYGLYLVHNWMPAIVEKFLGPMPKYAAAPIVLGLTFVTCALSWHFFEQPILSLKRYFSNSSLRSPVLPAHNSQGEAGERNPAQAL